ncbi:hypothetical protein GALL_340890 [mine drainage metagenome]|uniref:Uncharacterized protein n=1 Tax=mine drainage metagenome TaxID=410659 RepID=A0A1J5QKR1_9ZZZZ
MPGCLVPQHARTQAASLGLFQAMPTLGLSDNCIHLAHDLVMRNARARIINGCLHLGAEPPVMCIGFFGRGKH